MPRLFAMHPIGRFMIASTALPLAAPVLPWAAPALVGSWAVLHGLFFWSLMRSGGNLYAPNIRRGHGDAAALTFDDGPRGDETRALLDLLAAEEIRATFFVVGRRAREDPEVIRRMIREGHTIGNHTQSHPAGWAAAGRRRVFEEVGGAQETIAGLSGEAPEWFRPPMGHKNVYLREALERHGLRQVTWSTRSWDTVVRRPAAVAGRVLRRAAPGEIILLHEGLKEARVGRAMAIDLAPRLIAGLRSRGLRPVGLRELLTGRAPGCAGPSPGSRPGARSDGPAH
jgi:peptidoglycan/xylan/chitin deacetylase (PgdA/CDA1 family)